MTRFTCAFATARLEIACNAAKRFGNFLFLTQLSLVSLDGSLAQEGVWVKAVVKQAEPQGSYIVEHTSWGKHVGEKALTRVAAKDIRDPHPRN